MILYRVRNWNQLYENNRTRELKSLGWFPISNKMDGDGYTELLDHPDGMSHYAAWVLICGVASKCEPRGTLVRDGNIPHDSRSLARVTRGSAKTFDSAIPRLIAIGWLEVVAQCDSTDSDGFRREAGDDPALACGDSAPCCDDLTTHARTRSVLFHSVPFSSSEGVQGEPSNELKARALLLLTYLNEKAGRSFREVEPHLRFIRGRIQDADGDVEGIKQMIDRQVKLWKNTEWERFLRPETLFNATKFRSYYDDRSQPIGLTSKLMDHRAEKAAGEFKETIKAKELK